MLWCFILGFLHQRRWYSFILFPNLQCSVFVNTEEAYFEILLLENKQTLANTTHIIVTGQRGDGEQYRISRHQWWMGIYALGCSLRTFRQKSSAWFSPPKPRSDNNVSTRLVLWYWSGRAAWCCPLSHGSSQSGEFSNFYINLHWCWQEADQVQEAIKDPQNCLSRNIFTDRDKQI